MRGSRRCSKGSARVPPIQSCQYFVHPWSSWFDVDDDESNNDDEGDSDNLVDDDDDDHDDDDDNAVLRGWLVGT